MLETGFANQHVRFPPAPDSAPLFHSTRTYCNDVSVFITTVSHARSSHFLPEMGSKTEVPCFLPVYQACDPSSYFPFRKVSSLNSHLLGSTTRLPAFLKSCRRNDSPSLSAIIGRLKYKPDLKPHSSLLQRFRYIKQKLECTLSLLLQKRLGTPPFTGTPPATITLANSFNA